jgi:accessory gene regulator protein AgrB
MDNYTKCLTTGSILFLVPAWFIQRYNSHLSTIDISVYSFIILFLTVVSGMYSPVDSINKPIKENDKIIYKLKTMLYVATLGVIITLIPNNLIKFSLLVGAIIEVFTICPFGIAFFTLMEDVIDKIVLKIKGDKGCEK